MKQVTLEPPKIPVNFITEMIADGASDMLTQAIYDTKDSVSEDLHDLLDLAIWARDLKAHTEKHGGLVAPEINKNLVEKMVWAFDVLRKFRMIS